MIGEHFSMKPITKKTLFTVLFILFLLYFVNCLPIYIHINILGYPEKIIPSLSRITYDSIIQTNSVIKKYYYFMLNKIPEWTMPIAVIVNGINMFFGFEQFKKKWWYYVILLISILMSLMLIDCWWMLSTAE